MNRQDAESELNRIFGFEKFYDNQWLVIDKIFKGERVLLIEKTGFGKSLCYQFPAIQFPGTTIIFSPLIALMRDQVQKLQTLGIEANYISYQHSPEENQQTIFDALNGKLKILYIHPARMENIDWLEHARNLKISMVVVDEAHCISTWGHDFIPSYQKIVNLVNLLPVNFPVLATTATATPRVEEDIKIQIGKNISSVRGNLLRNNLHLYVVNVNSQDEKMLWLGRNLEKLEGTGVIYTGTRVDTEIYSKWFEYLKINSVHYNAGIDTETKKDIETGLMNNSYKCIVSTNALGMGIDKPDIRFIIHTQVTVSPIHYYQEIGRAGRDGKPAYIILFYNPDEDNDLPHAFINGARPLLKNYKKIIDILKHERLGLHGIIKAANFKQTEVRVILADLISQNIVVEINEGRSKVYEHKFNAPEFDYSAFDEILQTKLNEFDKILEYINYDGCRMNYLCDFLGDTTHEKCGNCDNDRNKHIKINTPQDWIDKLNDFKTNYFPVLEVETTRTNLVNGIAASYYGMSNVGKAIHRSKYENGGDYPDWLVQMALSAFEHHFGNRKFDLLVYVPPTHSGELVRNFAEKISLALKIPISHNLIKLHPTEPQKIFQSSIAKNENVKDAFHYHYLNEISGKRILLIDDVLDSGCTIKEIGRYLSKAGAKEVAPLVIAKTVGSDLI